MLIKYFKKIIFIAAVFAFFVFPNFSFAKSYQYEKIKVDIQINRDGTFNVEEELAFDFEGSFSYAYRDISLKKIDYISDIEVWDKNQNKKLDNIEISHKSGSEYVKWNFNLADAKYSWIVKYKVHGALGFYKEHDEIYWNAVFKDRDVAIKKAQVFIYLPESMDKNKMSAYSYGQNGAVQKIIDSKTFYFEAQNLLPYTDFTIAAGWPKGMFDYKTIFWGYWLNWQRLAGILLPIIIFMLMFTLWWKKGKDPKINKTIIAEYEPPTDLKPAEVEILLTEKVSNNAISAILVDLAVREYLKIYEKKEWLGKTYQFKILSFEKEGDNLLSYEKKLLEEMQKCGKHGENISEQDLIKGDFGGKIKWLFKDIYEEISSKGVFEEDPSKLRNIIILIFVLIVFSFGIAFACIKTNINSAASYFWIIGGGAISLIIALIFSKFMPKKTLKGAEDCWKWKGFKLYLETAEKYRMEACKPEYFEKYLSYAIVMKAEKKWGKAFEDMAIPVRQPDWYISSSAIAPGAFASSGGGFSPSEFANSISSMASSFVHSASNSKGGASFGGGSAGGGAGGGGGGAG